MRWEEEKGERRMEEEEDEGAKRYGEGGRGERSMGIYWWDGVVVYLAK